MTQKELRIGIVGASANGNGAEVSHVPAINGLSGLTLAAVATRNEESCKVVDEDSSAPAGSGLAAEDVGEVCRKDELVVGDDYGLVLRSGLSEETGHAGDCLNDDVSAE